MFALADYRCALAIAERRHFGRAARDLGMTQPALSSRLRRIETGLGVRLFERDRGGVEITAAGERFVEGALRIVDLARETDEATRDASLGLGQVLRVGMTQLAAVQVVVPALAGLREEHPQVRVRLIERTTAPLEQMLEAGTLDVAFLHPPLHTPGLSQSELTRAPLVRIAPGTDETFVRPLVRYPRGEAPVLMGDVERSSRDWDGQAPEVEADTMLGAVVLSRAGFGACVVADDYARSLGLRERVPDVTDLDVTIATSVAWRRLDRRSLVTALVSTATERTSEGSRS